MKKILSIMLVMGVLAATGLKALVTGEEIVPYFPKFIVLQYQDSNILFTASEREPNKNFVYVIDRKPGGGISAWGYKDLGSQK